MTDSGEEYERIVNSSIILIGSFQNSKNANDIDLIIIYEKYDFVALRALKNIIAVSLNHAFGLPVHYTTLSYKEYFQAQKLHVEKHRLVYGTVRNTGEGEGTL